MNWFELSVKVGADESVPVSSPTIYWFWFSLFIYIRTTLKGRAKIFRFFFLRLVNCHNRLIRMHNTVLWVSIERCCLQNSLHFASPGQDYTAS